MGLANSSIQMVTTTKACGRLTNSKALESMWAVMEQSTRAGGKMVTRKAMAWKPGPMVPLILAVTKTARGMVLVNLTMPMALSMRVDGSKAHVMDKESAPA